MSDRATRKSGPSRLFQADAASADATIVIGLNAVILAVDGDRPLVLSVRPPDRRRADFAASYGLPYGPFEPQRHRTFEIGLRNWVEEQTYLRLGYVEQLYTFGDKGRDAPIAALDRDGAENERIISVGYLALTPVADEIAAPDAAWRDWYRYFPWEDWRGGPPEAIRSVIAPRLAAWAERSSGAQRDARRARAQQCFALDGHYWDEEKVLDRYELLYEAGLAVEALRDRRRPDSRPTRKETALGDLLGEPMISDHRRILATAIGRLRGKLKYRPIIFELMPDRFTLFELQRAIEAICGFRIHKQNFRRVVERSKLVEQTGEMSPETGGRPAALFRYRRAPGREHAASGLTIPRPRLAVSA